MKSKVHQFNHELSRENYHIILIQQTWLNSNGLDEEIIGNTIRGDEAKFNSNRINGGGVLSLIHNSIQFAEVSINIKTTIEIQIVEVSLGDTKLINVNGSMPPARACTLQIIEFKTIIQHVKRDFPQHQLIVAGDYNQPNAIWKVNQTTRELFIENYKSLPRLEKRFFDVCTSFGLLQRNHTHNSRGTFLDLLFTSHELQSIDIVPQHCLFLLYNNTAYHSATTFVVNYPTEFKPDAIPSKSSLDLRTNKLSLTRIALIDVDIPLITNQDCAYYYTDNETKFRQKIDDFVNITRNIQDKIYTYKKA